MQKRGTETATVRHDDNNKSPQTIMATSSSSSASGSQPCNAAFSLNDNGWYNYVYHCNLGEHAADKPHEARVMEMKGACKGLQNLEYRVVLKEPVRWMSTDVALYLPLKLLPDSADGTPHGTLYASSSADRLRATTRYVTATFGTADLRIDTFTAAWQNT